jgi:hypothetical protein
MKRRRKHTEPTSVACPFCGEPEDVVVDRGGGRTQTYTEDCPVCCRPRVLHVEPGDGPDEVRVWAERGE